MTVFRNDDRWDRSNVLFEDGRLLRYDKVQRTPDMRHIDYGLGVLTARALAPFPADRPFDLAAVYQQLLADGDLAGLEVTDRFYEIGSPEGLRRRERSWRAKDAADVDIMSYARQHLQEAARIIESLDADAHRADGRARSPTCAAAAAACSSSASAAAPATARMPSTISASSPASRPTRRPTTSPS